MKKSRINFLIGGAIVISFVLNIFFGRLVAVKLSTFKLFDKWHILNPQTPIVINKKEEIRISDAGEGVVAFSNIKPKMSQIILLEESKIVFLGTATNLTPEGIFVTVKKNLPPLLKNLHIVTTNGKTGKVVEKILDPSTDLVFLKTDLNNLPVSEFLGTENLRPGEKLFIAGFGRDLLSSFFSVSFVSSALGHKNEEPFTNADKINKTFQIQKPEKIFPGDLIFNSKSEIVGIWNGENVVPGEVIKDAFSIYSNSKIKILRPRYGFFYKSVNKIEASLLGSSPGIVLKEIDSKFDSPAMKAGLAKEDIILGINGKKLSQDIILEELLQTFKSGSELELEIMRDKKKFNTKLIIGELK